MKLVLDSLSLFNLQSAFHKAPKTTLPPFLITPTSYDCGRNNFHAAYTTPET